jgi:PhzF family phenazine biosynthesis protein
MANCCARESCVRVLTESWVIRFDLVQSNWHAASGREKTMKVPIFQVDAFATRLFKGNPAAVVCLENFLSDETMQGIAAENNLAETAFVVHDGEDYRIRWFTPTTEVPLCGHATLASAAVIMERLQPGQHAIRFHSASGLLTVKRNGSGYVMNFPVRNSEPAAAPEGLQDALGTIPVEVLADRFNYLVLLENAATVRTLAPDIQRVARLDRSGVIVTASGDNDYDFVSRYFAPAKGIPEDPVTGGAHCALTPYWSRRLGKTELRAFQASPRGGELLCRLVGDRVELEGQCAFYLEGKVELGGLLD